MLRWFEHSQVYHPDPFMVATGKELGRPFQDVWFKSSDGIELNGWFFPAAVNSARRQMAVLVCHGNAGNISHRLELARSLLQTGVNVFLFDYRGFGRSKGWPSEEGTYLDAEAALEWLERNEISERNTVAFGESLGGGIVSELALRKRLAGVVLQSTFSCIPDIGADLFPWLPVKWLSTIKYDTCAKLPRLKLPVLVMHSRSDELVGFHHAQKNFALANEPKLFWELNGDHNGSLGNASHLIEGMESFLRMIEADAAERAGETRKATV